MKVSAKTLRVQEVQARRLLRALVRMPRRPLTEGALALTANALVENDLLGGEPNSASLARLNRLEIDLHEIGHVVAFCDGWSEARKQNFPNRRMSVSDVIESGPKARSLNERLRQEDAADRNEIEAIAFTWLTLKLLGHEVSVEPLLDFAAGTLENVDTDLDSSVKKALRSKRILGWATKVADLCSAHHLY